MVALRVVVCFAVLAVAAATDVNQCEGESFENLKENVQLSPCKKTPCRLKQGTDQHIAISFTPDNDIASLKNRVSAIVFGVPLPFVGVDGTSICDKIFLENDDKASCPLQAGTKYTYKDKFPVLSIYPKLSVNVHWELVDEKRPITCFEVPARIQ